MPEPTDGSIFDKAIEQFHSDLEQEPSQSWSALGRVVEGMGEATKLSALLSGQRPAQPPPAKPADAGRSQRSRPLNEVSLPQGADELETYRQAAKAKARVDYGMGWHAMPPAARAVAVAVIVLFAVFIAAVFALILGSFADFGAPPEPFR